MSSFKTESSKCASCFEAMGSFRYENQPQELRIGRRKLFSVDRGGCAGRTWDTRGLLSQCRDATKGEKARARKHARRHSWGNCTLSHCSPSGRRGITRRRRISPAHQGLALACPLCLAVLGLLDPNDVCARSICLTFKLTIARGWKQRVKLVCLVYRLEMFGPAQLLEEDIMADKHARRRSREPDISFGIVAQIDPVE
jgi:hypothetical protein